jgi:hypothetical protein
MSNCPLVNWAVGTGMTLIGFETSVTVKVPVDHRIELVPGAARRGRGIAFR